ncbi:MAG: sialate O-acetylesterase [Janthinobacterium lividum]
MILQRGQRVTLWGWAKPGERITVTFEHHSYSTITGTTGTWKTGLPAHLAGGPYDLTVQGENSIIIRDILFGDVWLCSGQSNMEYRLKRSQARYTGDIAQADNPQIRQFLVKTAWSYDVKDDVAPAAWKCATPANVLDFSAVAYFFAKYLYEKYHIPIGLINSSYGGTPVQSWMSAEALKAFPDLVAQFEAYRDTAKVNPLLRIYKTQTASWYQAAATQDAGRNHLDGQPSWATSMAGDPRWRPIQVPGFWEDQGLNNTDGVIWYQKEITIPANLSGKDALLNLGFIHQEDSTYFNGQLIGHTASQYVERLYRVPGALLKPGSNVITARVLNKEGNGGFLPDKTYALDIGEAILPLAGLWRYRIGVIVPPLQSARQKQFSREPAVLYNSMIAPLVPYRIKGVVWYQGENNTDQPQFYAAWFAALIRDWRKQWHQGNLPFVYAQLANYMPVAEQPAASQWAELREAQLKTLKLKQTGLAVLHDTGEWNDVHPTRKKEAGERLALAARHVAYGERHLVYSGPAFQAAHIRGQRIYLSFRHTGSGLIAKGGGALKQFAIAGSDYKFVWAKAEISGNRVVVWSNQVAHPVAVRYAWADNPAGANLYNQEGLPASSFRTD